MPSDDRAIAISATFTAEAIQPGLAFWARRTGSRSRRSVSPAITSSSKHCWTREVCLRAIGGGVNVALVRFEDWLRDGGEAGLEERARKLVEAVRGCGVVLGGSADSGDLPAHSRSRNGFRGLERV